MNHPFSAQFSINKENSTINVTRSFAASIDKVWAAWTQSDLLDQWWAPKPYTAKTKSMDFSEGGMWLYSMISQEGEETFCRADYEKIVKQESFSGTDAFCDSEGVQTNEFPTSHWNNTFTKEGDDTKVNLVIKYDSVEDMEKYTQMGFVEGFTAGMNNLDDFLAKDKNLVN